MALRNIIQEPSERLRKIARPVDKVTKRIEILLDDLTETMRLCDGVGLAAPQVGVLRRVVVVDVGDEHGLIELINPVITYREGENRGEEGCLSCATRRGMVVRPQKVIVEALNRQGEKVVYETENYLARAMCHEIDHLDGRLFIDIMDEELFDDEKKPGEKEEDGHEQL